MAFDNEKDAMEILSSLRLDLGAAAGLYDKMGKLLVRYRDERAGQIVPQCTLQWLSYSRAVTYLFVVQSVMSRDDKLLGMLYTRKRPALLL